MVDEIVVDAGTVVAFTVIVAWVLNQGYALASGLLRKAWPSLPKKLSAGAKKAVAFVASTGLIIAHVDFLAIELPAAGDNPSVFALAILAFAVLVFKAAQKVYDVVWKALVAA